jgi:hypothetical protein
MTRFGIENNHVRPKLTDRVSTIEIEGGRHPLQEMLTASFIANDTALIPDKTRMFVSFVLSQPSEVHSRVVEGNCSSGKPRRLSSVVGGLQCNLNDGKVLG